MNTRKIYVASSWRNPYQEVVVAVLRGDGHEVYDFKNPRPGDRGFSWAEIDPNWLKWTADEYIAALQHPIAKAGFKSDFDAMKWADTFVLVLPCGRSAHLELGWAAGQGKQTFVLTRNGEEPELMASMCDHICSSLEQMRPLLSTPSHPQQPSAGQGEAEQMIAWIGDPEAPFDRLDEIEKFWGEGTDFREAVAQAMLHDGKPLARPIPPPPPATGEPPAKEGETPRTEREVMLPGDRRVLYEYVPADFARQLERELTAAKAELARLKKMLPPEAETLHSAMKEIQADYEQAVRDRAYANERREKYRLEADTLRTRLAQLEADLSTKETQYAAALDTLNDVTKGAAAYEGKKDDAYWAGYRARLNEALVEQPEPKNPTLWRYLQNAHEKQITFHSIGVNRMPDGGFHFYIHPQSVSGDTEDFLIWPDPFNWQDMIVNRKDSPPPDVEGFKRSLKAAMSPSPAVGTGKEGQ